jgi:hypothetical protein
MSHIASPILDRQGRPLLACSRCKGPISEEDVFAQGLRLPDPGESADDYFEAELLDELHHVNCTVAQQAS